MTGTVAAAIRYVVKAILTGSTEKFFSSFHMPTLRDRLLEERGMGREVLLAFLGDIPGINDGSVQHQLANLKTSGDYARLIAEVEQEIAAEEADAQAALEQAEREQDERKRAEAEARKAAVARAHGTARLTDGVAPSCHERPPGGLWRRARPSTQMWAPCAGYFGGMV
jgi:hypothetical protein